ncbi:hypothetical protein GCM10017566_71790 [Amycolatopsis bartoniae]|uniref:DUF3592 domain-containing protein n=1 Tax=Amycolatopsis bartoniae TaxID=941986 RepID=A0A8H9MEF6_9PSEU|nr:hypothetical protein GCM10017566_71790 [Amycolatopsis bartoniae]
MGPRIAAGVVATVTTTSWLLPAALSGGVVGGVFFFVFLFVFVPFVVIFVAQRLGEPRRRRGKNGPLWPAVLLGAFGLVCLLPGAVFAAEGLMHLTGLAQPVELRITDVNHGRHGRKGSVDNVDGDYVLGGTTHHLDGSMWLSWAPLPEVGDSVPVTISRLWPTVMIEDDSAAWVITGGGAFGLVAGGVLMAFALREKKQAAEPV